MAIGEIIKWTSKLPDWQQDALRRIAILSDLTNNDISEILANLKIAEGLPQEGEQILQPLTENHVKPDSTEAPLALLCSVENVKNANRLAPNQALNFAINGITLIYGNNGSGKSGYCRILKKLCRAAVKDNIHPDVFATKTMDPAEAQVRFKLEGTEDIHEGMWRDGEEGPSDIVHLSVFDSQNARLYVDEQNRIDYLPYEIELLARFAKLLEHLNDNISKEIRVVDGRLEVELPTGYTPDTAVSRLVDQLTPHTSLGDLPDVEEINSFGSWPDELVDKLRILQQTIQNSPKVLADRYHRVQSVISTLTKELIKARDALSETKKKELEQAIKNAKVKVEAASLVATDFFRDRPLPLPHFGSEPWQQMFFYAKEYSKLVYPDVNPPATGDGDLCVLCQQPLSEGAAERLYRFESYVAGEAKKCAEEATVSLDKKLADIERVVLQSSDNVMELLGEYASLNEARNKNANEVAKFVQTVHNQRRELLEAAETGEFPEIIPLDGTIIDKLLKEEKVLGEEADACSRVAEDNDEIEKQIADLLDRKRLSENLKTVVARRNDLELRIRLQRCRDASRTDPVSHKVRAIRKKLVTKDLDKRIRAEIDNLSLNHIPLQVSDDTKKGESRFGVKLETSVKVTNRDVLSEGEQRALGLACFLADVGRQPVKHGIIVDDPVTSLDNGRLRRVAERLVREAASKRQVIIFTHNLPFFSEMVSLAGENQVPIQKIMICKEKDLFGVVKDDDQPWEVKSIQKRLELLDAKLKELEVMPASDSDNYREGVKSFYTYLRETWERLVEEVLLFKVVERFGSDIKTQRLKGVVVDDCDYHTIFWAMKRVSEHSGHDMAVAKNALLPEVEEMKIALSDLRKYYERVHKRTRETRLKREKLEKPREPITMPRA